MGPPSAAKLRDLVNDLMNSEELKKADAAVVTALDAYQAKGDWMAAATAHNLLGWIRRAQERYPEAARRHMRALALALQAGGPVAAESREAEAAYQGLSFVQASFHYVGRPEQAVALLHEAVAAADAAGVPQDSPGRKWGERRLRANARSAIAAAPAPPRAQGPQDTVGDVAEAARQVSPALRSGRVAKGPPSAAKLRDTVNDLMNSQELKKADAAVVTALDAYQAKGDWMAAATAHNLLGWIRRAQERYPEAARRHMQALALALQADGPSAAESQEAEAAYEGLSFVQASFHHVGKPEEAVALLDEAVAAADAAGVPQDSSGRKRGERRLRANARSTVATAHVPSVVAETLVETIGDAGESAGLVSV